jgi:hypothetical protein
MPVHTWRRAVALSGMLLVSGLEALGCSRKREPPPEPVPVGGEHESSSPGGSQPEPENPQHN